jgi:predicted Zn-dependent protease
MKKLLLFLLLFCLVFSPVPIQALISLEEEEKIGKEVLQEVSRQTELIQDQEVLYYINSLGGFLQKRGVGFSPFNFQFFLIKDSVFNAFSVPGGYIFLNSGIFDPLETEDELASILGHEMAHNLARHVAKRIETVKKMQIATTAATLAAILFGGGKAGEIAGITSTALAQTKLLAYSRQDEEEADRIGFEVISKAGFNPQAMVRVMERMIKLSDFAIELNYRYLLTHPLSQERYVYLKNLAERTKNLPMKDQYAFSHDEFYFKRIKARVKALSEDPADLLVKLRSELREAEIKGREDPYLRYTFALVLARARFFKSAEEEMLRALKELPQKPYYLLDLAEVYYLSGNYAQALTVLQGIKIDESLPIAKILNTKVKYLTARCLAETGSLEKAYKLFQELYEDNLVNQDYIFFYYFGLLCSRLDKQGESHFYFGRHYELKGDFRTALYHYKKALSFLPKDTKMYKEAEERVKVYEGKREKP